MKKDWKYILYLTLAFGTVVVVKLISPKQYDWSVTYAHEDKDPYGTFGLNALLPSLFPDQTIAHSYETLYELKDSLKRNGNILIISSSFSCQKEDTQSLLNYINAGGTAFISAQHFYGTFQDTLGFSTRDNLWKQNNFLNQADSAYIRFVNPRQDTTEHFSYRRDNLYNYFSYFDTTKTTVIARNDFEQPVSLLVRWGKGTIHLNCTPLAFTNIYLLAGKNHSFASASLSHLPVDDLLWTEYYHAGRMEASTPLRFILTNEPLSWAYYLTVLSLLIFMIFEMKRRQRIIPILDPPKNTTLEFVSTIGNLYYQRKEHKNIAEKKIVFLLEQIRSKYWLNTARMDEAFLIALTKKSGKPEEEVKALFRLIADIRKKTHISDLQLIVLNKQIEKFNIS